MKNLYVVLVTIAILLLLSAQLVKAPEAQGKEIIEEEVAIEPKSIEELIAQYDWNYNEAISIMMCESGGIPTALNNNPNTRDYSLGLFQINLYGSLAEHRPSEEWLVIPENNIAYAYELYKQVGWSAWANCSQRI